MDPGRVQLSNGSGGATLRTGRSEEKEIRNVTPRHNESSDKPRIYPLAFDAHAKEHRSGLVQAGEWKKSWINRQGRGVRPLWHLRTLPRSRKKEGKRQDGEEKRQSFFDYEKGGARVNKYPQHTIHGGSKNHNTGGDQVWIPQCVIAEHK